MTTTPTTSAGGRATEAGMSFEAVVGTWFAAHLITGTPVGARFGIAVDAHPSELQFETGEVLAYIGSASPVIVSDGLRRFPGTTATTT
jgi:hypothetical protein